MPCSVRPEVAAGEAPEGDHEGGGAIRPRPGKGASAVKITEEILRRKRACADQIAIFAGEWPEGCEVSEATLLRAAELKLDLTWFAEHFLPPPLWAEYRRQVALRLAEYRRQVAPLWAEYRRQAAPLIWALAKEAAIARPEKEDA